MADDASGVAASEGYLTAERIMMRDMAREFTREEVLPIANRLDPVKGDIPRELIEQMGELGFFGILIPEEYGGLGLGAFEYCLVAEELARGWMSVASIIARGNGFYRSIPGEGDARRRKIELMAKGRYLGAAALSEPGTGSDLSSVTCRARRDGDDWVITGNKYWCTFADGADYISVLCRIDDPDAPGGRGRHGRRCRSRSRKGELPAGRHRRADPQDRLLRLEDLGAALRRACAPRRASRPDRQRRGRPRLPGRSPSASAWPAPTPRRARSAWRAARWRTPSPTPGSACSSASRSPTSRPSASRSPRMATEIEAARQLMYFVCSEIDAGRPARDETSMVKFFASEMAERVTSEALQIFGGAGYTTLHPIERYWRDARLTKIFEGTIEIQQRIIADTLLGKPTVRGSN